MENRTESTPCGYIDDRSPSISHVRAATERFMTVNRGRIARVREGLQAKQQQCFDILALLLHANIRGLPGYLNHSETPVGIANYQPSPVVLRQTQLLTQQRVAYQPPPAKAELSALYLMGSSGSVGQSSSSDLDIWICYDSDLTSEKIRLLEEKATLITEWAANLNMEVNFFLMDAHRFSGGEQQSLTGENCGSTQHVLLLDEFYRTAQLLAGNPPLWWFIPSACEEEYSTAVAELRSIAAINTQHSTDFGPISKLPAGEFIGAGMWQIYKAVDSPYKSVLKLILLEIYARQFPTTYSLAHQYKDAIYQSALELDQLDPYIMLYRRIDAYLCSRKELKRLELIRRCFYFKVGLNLSKPTRSATWRRELMESLVRAWGWSRSTLQHLDNFRAWSIDDVMTERQLLINELTNSYRFLTEFAAEHHSSHLMSQRDLVILSRKLHAAFDRRPGKIDFVRIGLDVDLSHEKIRIQQHQSEEGGDVYLWAAYNQLPSGEVSSKPLKYSKGLLETLLWSHLNGLIAAHLHIPVTAKREKISDFELRMTLSSMRQLIPVPTSKTNSDHFYKPAQVTQVVCFINLGRDPLNYLSRKGLQKISARSNSLDFSARRENLVLSIDMVLINTWGEVVVEHYSEDDALVRGLKSLVNRLNRQSQMELPSIETVCHNQTRPKAIARRVKDLYTDALTASCCEQAAKNSRFVFNVRDQFMLLQRQNRVANFSVFQSSDELLTHLTQAQLEFSPVFFDRQCQHETPLLAQLYQNHNSSQIRLAFEVQTGSAILYLLDEQGSLIRFTQSYHNRATLLAPLVRFLKVTEHRQRSDTFSELMPQRTIQCFKIMRQEERVRLEKIKIGGLITKGQYICLQVSVEIYEQENYEYYVVCNDKEFNSSILGDHIFSDIATYLLQARPSGEKYPIYITDLVLNEAAVASLAYGNAQTLHYMKFKLEFERRLNDALQKL